MLQCSEGELLTLVGHSTIEMIITKQTFGGELQSAIWIVTRPPNIRLPRLIPPAQLLTSWLLPIWVKSRLALDFVEIDRHRRNAP
jgi:hypothetical protein